MLVCDPLPLLHRLVWIDNLLFLLWNVGRFLNFIQDSSIRSVGLRLSFLLQLGMDLHHTVALQVPLLSLGEHLIQAHPIPTLVLVLSSRLLLIDHLLGVLLLSLDLTE